MTRGRKLSASSIREKVEKILGIDDNPYGLPPIAKDPNTDNKRYCLHNPSCIPLIGKLLPKPKPKAVVSRRRRSSSLPARYQAIYAETAPGIEITPEHFADFDKREKAYYDFFPHLRPCMTIEEYNEEYAKWEAKYNAKHLKKKPLKYYPWERKYGSRELLNPRTAPRPPGFVERPVSKALPPLPSPSDARSTCDTDYLISQFPPPPEAIPSTTLAESSTKTAQQPPQRQRSGSEGTIQGPRTVEAIKFALRVQFAPDIRSKQCHCDDDSYAGTLSRPTEVHHLDERREPPPQLPTHVVNMFRTQDSKSNRATPLPTDVTLALEAQLTEWEDEITREDARREAHAEALRKLESNQSLSQSLLPQAHENYAQLERELFKDYRAKVEAAKKEERERKNEDENKDQVEKKYQRQRLKFEPKLRHGPSSSSAASGAQESHRNRQPHEGNRPRKGSRPQLEDADRLVHNERKTEKDHQRERNKSEPKRQAPGPSTSSSVAPNNRRERQLDGNAKAGVESRAQDDPRRRNVRKSVSTSKLYDMVQPKSHLPPQELRQRANADAPVIPSPTQALPFVPITSITPSNRGVRIGASNSTATPTPITAQSHAPKAIRPRPSRPNLGPPPSLSSGASGHRTRTPSATKRSEEIPASLKERVARVALNRKASNSNLDYHPLDMGTISAPVRHIKGAEIGSNQSRPTRLHVQDLQVTMIPLQYKVQYPSAPEGMTLKAGPKERTAEASGTSASSQAATTGTQLNPTTPPPTQTVHIFSHTVDDSPSSASSYGSTSSGSPDGYTSSHYGGYAGSSTTTLATHYGYVQRSYEDCISPDPAKLIPLGTLRTGNVTSAESRTKTSLTPMHVPLPKTGTLTGGATRPAPQVNVVASSSRDVIDNIPKNNYPPTNANPDFEDEELIRGYKPRKFVDVKKLIQEERDRVHRERKELPIIPFPVSVGDIAPLRIRKKASQLQA